MFCVRVMNNHDVHVLHNGLEGVEVLKTSSVSLLYKSSSNSWTAEINYSVFVVQQCGAAMCF